jgi:hypothetical protein
LFGRFCRLLSHCRDQLAEAYRIAGADAGRVLNGRIPLILPVQQSSKTELIINMKTAKALGLTFLLTLLGRADEMIVRDFRFGHFETKPEAASLPLYWSGPPT